MTKIKTKRMDSKTLTKNRSIKLKEWWPKLIYKKKKLKEDAIEKKLKQNKKISKKSKIKSK
jgi:hypothetical protein